jgi:uncharacterized protein Yka (UPF0111/DUF47 family)
MLRVTKREAVYFTYFSEIVVLAREAAKALEEMMCDYCDVEDKIKKISSIEHDCDQKIHTIFEHLNAAFITPIDREDIYMITKELDNIVDNIDETAHLFAIYNIREIKPKAIEIARLIRSSIDHLGIMFDELVHMKVSKKMLDEIIEINRIENLGDQIYRDELKTLFADDSKPVDIIRWEGIYEYLEKSLDSSEDVANIVEGVVMKHA